VENGTVGAVIKGVLVVFWVLVDSLQLWTRYARFERKIKFIKDIRGEMGDKDMMRFKAIEMSTCFLRNKMKKKEAKSLRGVLNNGPII